MDRFNIILAILISLSQINTAQATEAKPVKPLIIAIIDTGIDIHHPMFKKLLWSNTSNTKSPQHGWNFINNTADIYDLHGHGTHIAGIIAEQLRQSADQVRPVQLMSLKYFDSKNTTKMNLKSSVEAIHFAVKNGAHIINYSGGGYGFSNEEYAALKYAEQNNVLVVAAAGNETWNIDHRPYYPAAYPLTNILSVGSVDEKNRLADHSNFGKNSVSVAAPGVDIRSASPGGRFEVMSGTSQATAYTTGAAANLLRQWDPTGSQTTSPKEVIAYVLKNIKPNPLIEKFTISGGTIDPERFLNRHSQKQNAFGRKIANVEDIKSYNSGSKLLLQIEGLESVRQGP